jgi:hypothetical protein
LVKKVVAEVYAARTGSDITDGNISLGCRDTIAFEVQCQRLRPILDGKKHNPRIRALRETVVDQRACYWENNTPEWLEEAAKFKYPSTVMHFREATDPYPANTLPKHRLPVPRRHMGVADRMYTHCGMINGVPCTMTLFFVSSRIAGDIPVPTKKAQKLFDRIDKEYTDAEEKRLGEAERLRKLEEDERLNVIREKARALRKLRMEQLEARQAGKVEEIDNHHKLSRIEFLRKYAAPANMPFLEFKELWGGTEYVFILLCNCSSFLFLFVMFSLSLLLTDCSLLASLT